MDFGEVDRRYVDLKRQYDNGSLSAEVFDEQLEEMMVEDERGRWWAKSHETGEWHYYDGSTWVRDTPPETTPVEEPPPVQPPPAQEPPPAQPSSVQQPPAQPVEPPPALERPGPWIGGGIAVAVVGFFAAAGAGATSPLEAFGLLLSAVGLYCGYKAVQKGSKVGGLATVAVSGIALLFTLLFVLDQTV